MIAELRQVARVPVRALEPWEVDALREIRRIELEWGGEAAIRYLRFIEKREGLMQGSLDGLISMMW